MANTGAPDAGTEPAAGAGGEGGGAGAAGRAVAAAGSGGRSAAGSGGAAASGGRSAAGSGTSGGGGGTGEAGIDAGEPNDADEGPLPRLRVYSDTASIEYTPALVAARSFYGGEASVQSGGIANLFNAGQADLATNAETQALRQSAQRPNLRIICTVTETFYRIVAHRGAGIAQLSDLRGKRVGTIMNTSAHYYLDKMLRTVGMTAADVTVMSIFPLSGMPEALQSRRVDAVTSWEPEPQRAADLIGDDAIVFQDRSVYREIVNLHATAETLADPEKRRGIVAFVRALALAAKQFQTEPEKAWPVVSDVLGYDAALIEKVWPLERFPGALVPDLEVDQRLQRLGKGPAKYAGLIGFTRDVLTGRAWPERAEPLGELFGELAPGRRLAVNARGVPVVHGASGSETPIDRLSGSEQQAFLFAATTVMLALQDSVVLIDTIELRLAPGEAARFLRVLMAAAPSNQWIVTTCDPGVIALTPQHARVQLG